MDCVNGNGAVVIGTRRDGLTPWQCDFPPRFPPPSGSAPSSE